MKRCVNTAAAPPSPSFHLGMLCLSLWLCVGFAAMGGLIASRWEGWDFSFTRQAEEGGSARCHPSPLFHIVRRALFSFWAPWPLRPHDSLRLIEWERAGNKSSGEPPDIEPSPPSESAPTKITIHHAPGCQSHWEAGAAGSAAALVGRLICLGLFVTQRSGRYSIGQDECNRRHQYVCALRFLFMLVYQGCCWLSSEPGWCASLLYWNVLKMRKTSLQRQKNAKLRLNPTLPGVHRAI